MAAPVLAWFSSRAFDAPGWEDTFEELVSSQDGLLSVIILSARLGALPVLEYLWQWCGASILLAVDATICALCAEVNSEYHWHAAEATRLHEPLRTTTPLIAASCGGHAHVVEFLVVTCGANVTVGDEVRSIRVRGCI